ncbi:MAG TPA: chromate efflux transporter [Gemmatimonadales bacterium]|jgi:chromate transporter
MSQRFRGSLRELWWYFLRLGSGGFGGPIALVGYMQRDLVETRGWITPTQYSEGLTLAQLAPGPLAAQLAMYIGWLRGGIWGATLIGVAFVAPSFLMVLALSALYVRYGGLPWMQGAFYGIGAAVIAIIVRSAVKLVRLTLRRDRVLWAIFAVNAALVVATQSEILWVFLASGIAVLLVREMPRLGLPGVAADAGVLLTILWFFIKAGVLVFGSGLAIVPFLYGGAVQDFRWLTERQFLDAVAVSMITPGPVVITVAFIGYLVAGLWGATLASLGIFLPTWLAVVVTAPSFSRIVTNLRVRAFVDGVTAAATGAIAGAAVVLGRRAIVDLPTAAIAATAVTLLLVFRNAREPLLIVAAGLAGMWLTQPNPLP